MKILKVVIVLFFGFLLHIASGCISDKDPVKVQINGFEMGPYELDSYMNVDTYNSCPSGNLGIRVGLLYHTIQSNKARSLYFPDWINTCYAFQIGKKYDFLHKMKDVRVFRRTSDSAYVNISNECMFESEEYYYQNPKDIVYKCNLLMNNYRYTYNEYVDIFFVIQFKNDQSDSLPQKIKVEIEMENTTFVDSTHFVVITDEY
ncbi:MAG: hypothetical protein GX612_04335 [Bacteroidales bacterium]|nr:hypothetical protein [Bacteroidales bacterium]